MKRRSRPLPELNLDNIRQEPRERNGYWCHPPTRIADAGGIDVWGVLFAPFGSNVFDDATITEIRDMLETMPRPYVQQLIVMGEAWMITFAVNASQRDYAQEIANQIVLGLDRVLGIPGVYR